jgi:DNA-binding response OmpR family regulator
MPGPRILLVDDEALIHQLYAEVLRDEGYAVDVAISVATAMNLLNVHAYAAVIADWRLPDGDGLLVADTAAQLGAKSFLMSGYLMQMPGGRAEEHITLMKPVRPERLADAVASVIGRPVRD